MPGKTGVEVVFCVGVGHHHVLAASGLDPGDQRRSITARWHIHHARSLGAGDLLRAVRGPVVGHHHLARDAAGFNRSHRLAHADGQRLRLIQARHKNRKFEIGH